MTNMEVEVEDNPTLFERDNIPENIDHIPADDVVSLYFRQMASEPLLTHEQEIELAKRIETGQEAQDVLDSNSNLTDDEIDDLEKLTLDGQFARDHFARANTRLVVSIAKRYRNQGFPMSDLIQEGNVGLMIAIDKFDHTLGYHFSTYATWWIRQTITRALAKKSRLIRLPLNRSEKLRRIGATQEILRQELGRTPTEAEIGERLDMEGDEIRDLIEGVPQTIALEMTIGEDSELGDLIEDEDSPSPDEAMDVIMLTDVIEDILGELVPREADILRLRFGLDDGSPKTLEQVGDALGLSRERIRQIEASVLRKLREPYYRRKLQDFVPA